MFLTENFKNFIKSSVSSSALQAYANSSFSSVTHSLMSVLGQIKSKAAMANGLLSIFDMAMQDEDPAYLRLMNTDLAGAVQAGIHDTEYGDEIQSALSELSNLSEDCGVSDSATPTGNQSRSISVFGPDGRQYDFVFFNAPRQIGEFLCHVATCEDPTELGDAVILSKDGHYKVNPVIRGNNFINGVYYPTDTEAKILYFSQLYGITVDLTDSRRDQLYTIAVGLGIGQYVGEQDGDIDIANIIIHYRYHDDESEDPIDDIDEALNRMLFDAFAELGLDEMSGSVTTISTLASSFAEQNSVDELHINVIDALLHNHFSEGVISGIATQYSNMRSTYSSAVNRLHQAIGRGGITGLAAYLIEYYKQQSNQSGSQASQTWSLSDQSKLVPKNFVCNVGSIVLQAFSVLAQVIGTFFGIIGMAIGGVLSTGFSFVSKLVGYVNDKGRAFYTTDLSFLPACNVSIFQSYVASGLLGSRLLNLLLANPSVYTSVPGGILVLSLDSERHRVIIDVHPSFNSVDLSELIRSSTAYEAIAYCDAYFRHMSASDILNWYAQHCSQSTIAYDPSASAVSSEDPAIAKSYLSAATDALMLENLRKNTTVFYAFLTALASNGLPFAGWEAMNGGTHQSYSSLFTEALFCGMYTLGTANAAVINTSWGWGTTWASYIRKLADICTWTKSLWDPDLPTIEVMLFTDRSSGSYPSDYGIRTVRVSNFLSNLVSSSNAYTLSDVTMISNDAQWALIAPQWNSGSFWQVFIGAAIVTAVIATAVVISSVVISRKISSSRAKRQAAVEKAWSDYAKNPSDAGAYDNYRRSVRSNNLFASVFGGTKYSKNNYWETIGDDETSSSTSGQGDTLITRLYDQYTGTDIIPDPINEVKILIRGTV